MPRIFNCFNMHIPFGMLKENRYAKSEFIKVSSWGYFKKPISCTSCFQLSLGAIYGGIFTPPEAIVNFCINSLISFRPRFLHPINFLLIREIDIKIETYIRTFSPSHVFTNAIFQLCNFVINTTWVMLSCTRVDLPFLIDIFYWYPTIP